jgi:hypothetical protein
MTIIRPGTDKAAGPARQAGPRPGHAALSVQDGTFTAPVLDAGLGNDMNDQRPASGCKEAHGEERGGTGAPGL